MCRYVTYNSFHPNFVFFKNYLRTLLVLFHDIMHSTQDFHYMIGSLFRSVENSRKGLYTSHYYEDCRKQLFFKHSHMYSGLRWLIVLYISTISIRRFFLCVAFDLSLSTRFSNVDSSNLLWLDPPS